MTHYCTAIFGSRQTSWGTAERLGQRHVVSSRAHCAALSSVMLPEHCCWASLKCRWHNRPFQDKWLTPHSTFCKTCMFCLVWAIFTMLFFFFTSLKAPKRILSEMWNLVWDLFLINLLAYFFLQLSSSQQIDVISFLLNIRKMFDW